MVFVGDLTAYLLHRQEGGKPGTHRFSQPQEAERVMREPACVAAQIDCSYPAD